MVAESGLFRCLVTDGGDGGSAPKASLLWLSLRLSSLGLVFASVLRLLV